MRVMAPCLWAKQAEAKSSTPSMHALAYLSLLEKKHDSNFAFPHHRLLLQRALLQFWPWKLCGPWGGKTTFTAPCCVWEGVSNPCCRPNAVLSEWNLTASVHVVRCVQHFRLLHFPFSAADYMCVGLSGSASCCGVRWNHSTQQSYSSSERHYF